MAKYLQLTPWNANGLTQHAGELKTFISIRNIDVMLMSETHFTEKSCPKLPKYLSSIIRTIQPELLEVELL
jgi:exonuclease III